MYVVTQEEAYAMQNDVEYDVGAASSITSPTDSSVMYVHGTRGPHVVSPLDFLPPDPGLAEDQVEDAFLALGRMMKGAGKSLWRKVSGSRRGSAEGLREENERDEEEGKRTVVVTTERKLDDERDRKKKQGSLSKRLSKGFTGWDAAAMLATENQGSDVLSLQAMFEESKLGSSPDGTGRSYDDDIADIVLMDPNAPHPSEEIELPGTLPADFLNITQPNDEPSPPTMLPDLADDETDSEHSHSTAGQFELPPTPPAEFVPDSAIVVVNGSQKP